MNQTLTEALVEATKRADAREITRLLQENNCPVSSYIELTNTMDAIDYTPLAGSTRNVSIVDLLAYNPNFYKDVLPAVNYQLFTLLPLMRDDQDDESLAIAINYCDRMGIVATPLLVRITYLIYAQLKAIGIDRPNLFHTSAQPLKRLLTSTTQESDPQLIEIARTISSYPQLKMKVLWLIAHIPQRRK